jgi:hypothetical protein
MAKRRRITIDFNTWVTQAEYAKINKVEIRTVNKRVERSSIDTLDIPELKLKLIRRSEKIGRAYTKKK